MGNEWQTQHMRSWRERAVQTLAYEIGGIVLITPLFASATDHGVTDSAFVIIALTLIFLIWTFVHNLTFDIVERHYGGGPSSARSHPLRIVHALSLEVSSAIFTLPLIMWMVGLSFWQALLVDIGLSVAYALYAYVFHLAFDRIRPVSA